MSSFLKPIAAPMITTPVRIAMLSTPAPESAALERFGAGLRQALDNQGADVTVVDIDEVEHLNLGNAAILQHDFHFHPDADKVVGILAAVSVPSVVVLHTVPKMPTAQQRSTIEAIAEAASHVVVLSQSAAGHLRDNYSVGSSTVTAIPYGTRVTRAPQLKRPSRPTILTWGWLGPGDGVARVIDGMESLRGLPGRPRYLIAGPTHPGVVAAEGEAYRESLIERVRRLGLTDCVTIDGGDYEGTLTTLLQQASVVALPYDSTDLVASPALVESIARGRPVVATAFPHAVELLGTGVGSVVGHDDPEAFALAIRRVLTQPRLSGSMAAEARRLAPELDWNVVASAYVGLVRRLLTQSRVARW